MKHFTVRPARPCTARTAAAVVVTTALAVLAGACGGAASSPGDGGSTNAGESANSTLLAFSQCMRSRGVPNFPDPEPGAGAKFPSAQQLGVSGPRYQAAENACQHLLPVGANDQFPPAEVPLLLTGMRAFSQCMRSRGVPNWPDPTVNSAGQPFFDLGAQGITRGEAHSTPMMAKEAECQHLLPSALGGTPIG